MRALPGGVEVRVDGAVATVSLNRPDVKNAQTFATWASLQVAARTLPSVVSVVLLRSTGPDFSAGLDLRLLRTADDPRGGAPAGEGSMAELIAAGPAGRENTIAEFQQAFSCWREIDPIVIAVIQGRAIGAGFQLALAADLRLAETTASFTMAEVTLGLVPDLGGTHRLIRLIGYARALQVCASARPIDASTALGWGLVNDCAPPSELDDRLAELTQRLTGYGPTVLTELKTLLRSADEGSYVEQLAAERAAQARLLGALSRSTERS